MNICAVSRISGVRPVTIMMASGHHTVCLPWRVYPPRLACKAANTFSAVSGKSITRTPTASHTALAMAAATGVLLLSPMPLLWYGAGPGPGSSNTVTSSGISLMVGTLY